MPTDDEASERLRLSLERFAEAEALAHIGSWERGLVPAEQMTWSDELCRIWGLPPGSPPPTFEAFLGSIHPEDREPFRATVRGAVERGTPYEIEYRVVRPDGSLRHVLARGHPVLDAAGRPVRLFGVAMDVTDRKRAEEELAFRARVLDLSRDSIFVVDEQGRFLYVNEAAYLSRGYKKEEFLAMDLTTLDTPEYAPRVGERIAQIASAGTALFESAHRRKDGSVMDVEINSRVLDVTGRRVIVSSIRDITERKRTEEALRKAGEKLRHGIDTLEERNRQILILAEMGRTLQACGTTDDAWGVAGRFVERLFPQVAGELLACRGQDGALEPVAWWGIEEPSRKISASECWAVQSGQPRPVAFGPECEHPGREPGSISKCVALSVRGESFGVLRFDSPPEASHRGRRHNGFVEGLAIAAAEQISLALANLKLREILRDQAMRDPLTGLYNRRFLEEALARELARARRKGGTLGVLMLDLDHFKAFNDTFGHEAGDALLRGLGGFLRGSVRATDVACRYGGEEFMVLLPEASLEDTRSRAERLRVDIRGFHGPGPLALTISIGAAVFPLHGTEPGELLRAADLALYQAKAGGRDRVELFGAT